MTESEFKNIVQSFLHENNIYQIKYWGGGRFTRAGVPDLLCCINGRFVAVELKVNTNKPSKLQEYHINKIIASGGIGLVLYPEGFSSFKKLVKELMECKLLTAE